MSEFGHSKGKSRRKGLQPVMGLVFAALLLVVSYALAPITLEAIGSIDDEWDTKIREDSDPDGELLTEFVYMMTLVLWLVLMGVSVAIVAVAIGKDPAKESLGDMPVSPANKQALVKQMKRDLRDAKRRARKQGRKKK